MKVSGTRNRGSVGTTSKVGTSGATGKANKAGGSQSEGGRIEKAAVTVTASGPIASTLASDAAQRADKVASLKMEVLSGEYDPDSQKTAEKILQNLTDYSLA